jgi:hypothetical protein
MPVYGNREGSIILLEDGRCVPADPGNRDYAKLVKAGVQIGGYVAPPHPPQSSPQERLAAFLAANPDVRALISA